MTRRLDTDEHGFWDGPTDLDAPLVIAEDDPTIDGEHETLVYMGSGAAHTQADRDGADRARRLGPGPRVRGLPRDALRADHDADRSSTTTAASALRAARLLRRYP